MAFRWSGKKDQGVDDMDADQPASGAGESAQLQQLTETLGQLGDLLGQTNEQVVSYLVHRESQAVSGDTADGGKLSEKLDELAERLDKLAAGTSTGESGATASSPAATGSVDPAAIQDALRPLQQKLEQIEAALGNMAAGPAAGQPDAILTSLGHIGEGINSHHEGIAAAIGQLQQHVLGSLHVISEQLRPQEPEEEEAPSLGSSTDWQRAIFGSDLTEAPGLAAERQQLLDAVLSGDAAAAAFVGQLMVFRSAMTDKMPQLLKELGEAYYRWQPKRLPGRAPNPMEQALVAWLQETLQDAGTGNTIELVHPGERFDSTRHTATTRGVEITEVLGWIVLRDNGRVYTKALVAVK